MSVAKRVTLAALLMTAAAGMAVGGFQVRQYYSGWQRHPRGGYSYRTYYYKPNDDYAGYKHHYVVYHPKDPDHYYFYNPYKKQYWGRCPSQHGGKPLYSLLAERDRRPTISEIPEAAFPKPAAPPVIPEATDKEPLDLPPDEAPTTPSVPANDLPPAAPAAAGAAPIPAPAPAAPAAPQ